MKTDLYNINRKSIEPNNPLSPSERIKLIKNLVKNKFLKQQDIKKTLDSMNKSNEEITDWINPTSR